MTDARVYAHTHARARRHVKPVMNGDIEPNFTIKPIVKKNFCHQVRAFLYENEAN